ncbi:hypothetical protein Tco_0766244, partial [Tanacetum coccineum]
MKNSWSTCFNESKMKNSWSTCFNESKMRNSWSTCFNESKMRNSWSTFKVSTIVCLDNRATKKTQKTLLKQQYENFCATSTESLDSIFNRLQKIVSRLAILGLEIETMSIDDLYNNFKIVEQKIKKTVGTSSGVQNLAFMTAPSSSSTNDANTTCLH